MNIFSGASSIKNSSILTQLPIASTFAKQTKTSKWRAARASLGCLALITTLSIFMLSLSPTAKALTKATESTQPWVVRALSYAHGDLGGACSGAAINEQMVITAAHCKADVIMYEDIDHFVIVESHFPIDGTDIQVLVLRDSHPISQYPVLGSDRLANAGSAFAAGTIGTVYGYGPKDDLPQKRLSVSIDRHGATPSYKEYLQTIVTNGGETEQGDSGGPLIINNQLVGILSGSRTHPKDGHRYEVFSGISPALSTIRQLEHAREMRSIAAQPDNQMPWISAVKVENQALSLTLSDELINSGKQIVAWINGRYLGEIHGNHHYYATKQVIPGGAIFKMGGFRVRDTDIIQVGIVTGNNSPESSTLLYQSLPSGIQAVNIEDGKLTVTMSSPLVNSGHKIVAWINGKYTGEVQSDVSYYAEKKNIDGASVITFTYNPTQYGDLIQIGIVTNTNAPEASLLLFNGRPSGIESVAFNNDHFNIKMTPPMVHSAQRLIIWVDGAYSAELYKGLQYYGKHTPVANGALYNVASGIANATSNIQIGIVPGEPGEPFDIPETAKILYSN